MTYTPAQIDNLRNEWTTTRRTMRQRGKVFTVKDLRSIEGNLGRNCTRANLQVLVIARIPWVSQAALNVLVKAGVASHFPKVGA
jgi:hypothetical protein